MKPYTIAEIEKILANAEDGNYAMLNMIVKYSAAAAGIFDFAADSDYYLHINAGENKKAQMIIKKRLALLKKKGGKIVTGEKREKAAQVYTENYRQWIKKPSTRRLKNFVRISRNMSYYTEPVRKPRKKKAARA